MLTENDSHYLLQECIQAVRNEDSFNIVKGMGAKFGVDGNQYYYGFGELSEQNSVYGPLYCHISDAFNEWLRQGYKQPDPPTK